MMSQKNSAKQGGHLILLLILIAFLLFILARPVNKFDEARLVSLQNTAIDSYQYTC